MTKLPAHDSVEKGSAKNVIAVASEAKNLSAFVSDIETTDLAKVLEEKGPFTVFDPTNEAFESLSDDILESQNEDKLEDIFAYHIVGEKLVTSDFKNSLKVETLRGEELTIRVQSSTISINEVDAITTDLEASSGIIHIIDGIITSPLDQSTP